MKQFKQHCIKVMLLCLMAFMSTMQLNAQSWQNTGSADFSEIYSTTTSLVFNGSTPYVAYQDGSNNSKATVKKFNGTDWVTVGTEGFSAQSAEYISLAFNGNTPYVAYSEGSFKATVMKFDGTNWVTVGAANFSSNTARFTSLAFNGNTPYVAFEDGNNSGKATVMKFDGTNWITVGNAGFSGNYVSGVSLAFNSNAPYIAYADGSNSNKATVMKFNGTSWVAVGTTGFSADQASYTSLAFSGSTPFVAYKDYGNNTKATVKKYDGTNWVTVGNEGFSAGGADYTSLAFNGSIPYVAYKDVSNSNKATVRKFDGTNWITVGNEGFSVTVANDVSLAFNGNIPYVAYYGGSLLRVSVMQFGAISAPTIASFTPTIATVGATITITGTGFTNASAVNIGSTAASSFIVVNDNVINAVVGSGTNGNVSVTTTLGTATLGGFTYFIQPSINTVSGNGTASFGGDGGYAINAGLSGPQELVFDAAGNYYIVDGNNNRIRKVTISTGIITTVAGNGSPNSSGDGGQAIAAGLSVYSIALDNAGNIYVADSRNSRIRKITISTGIISTIAGNGVVGYNGDGGLATAASLNSSDGIAVDANGNVYISDYDNNRIRKINVTTGIITTIAGTGTSGYSGDGGAATAAKLYRPAGIVLDKSSSNLYIADYGFYHIRKLNLSTGIITTIAGIGSTASSGDGGLATSASLIAYNLALDADGNLYAADAYNNNIRKITMSTGIISTVAGNGTAGFSGDGGSALLAKMSNSFGVAIDASGSIYIADVANNRIRKVSITPTINLFAPTTAPTGATITIKGSNFTGTTSINFGGISASSFVVVNDTIITAIVGAGTSGNVSVITNGGTGSLAGFSYLVAPSISYTGGTKTYTVGTAITALSPVNSGGTVTGNGQVVVSTFVGSGSAGSTDGASSVSSFNYPTGAAIDALGNMYVADSYNHKIRKVSPLGVVTTLAGSGSVGSADGTGSAASFNYPYGVAIDAIGNVYVADYNNNKIRKVSPLGVVTTLAGSGAQGSADGTGSAATFGSPTGVAVDAVGNVYVADILNNKIRKVSSLGVVTTLAGSGSAGSADGTGSAASFNRPTGVAIDAVGNVYVSDTYNQKIRKVSPLGVVTTLAGSGSVGSADGTGSAASFAYAAGVAVDAVGNVYVADTDNSKVRKVSLSGVVTTLAGSGATGSADGTGSAASFHTPYGLGADASGNVYLADATNNKIRKISPGYGYTISPTLPTGLSFDASTGIISGTPTVNTTATTYTITATNMVGSSTATVNIATVRPPTITSFSPTTAITGNTVTINGANFIGASAISFGGTVATSFVVISDNTITAVVGTGTSGSVSVTTIEGTGSLAGLTYLAPPNISYTGGAKTYTVGTAINPLTPTNTGGAVLTTVSSFAGKGPNTDGIGSAASFQWPNSVAIDASGNLYVSDASNNRIRKISPSGAVTTLAGSGSLGSLDGKASEASFNYPSGLAVDISGNVYVADCGNNMIRKVSATGVVTTLAGSINPGSTDGLGSAASFYRPTGLAVDASGNVYVADFYNYKIRKISPLGVVTTLAGSGSAGSADGIGNAASFNYPYGVALDAQGNLYVGDQYNYKIRKISPSGAVTTFAGTSAGYVDGTANIAQFNSPTGIAVDASGNVYVADQYNNRIRKISPSGIVTSLAGNSTYGGGSADGIGSEASFYYPTGVAVDISGNVYVADMLNNKIRKVSATGTVTTFAGSKSYGNADGTGSAASFNYPTGVGLDTAGNIYVADMNNNSIRKVSNFGVVTTLAGSGSFGSVDGTGSIASFSSPAGVAIDVAGNVYVADAGNNKIRKISTSGIVTTLAGSGSAGSADGTGSAASFNNPNGVTVDAAGNVYVADMYNQKIRKVSPLGVVTTLAGSGNFGNVDGTGSAASFAYPSGVAVDVAGNVIVADFGNNQIRRVSTIGEVSTLVAGVYTGTITKNHISIMGVNNNISLVGPFGVAVDLVGNVYVAERDNNHIRKVSPLGEVTNLAGSNVSGSADGSDIASSFNYPIGVAIDPIGNVYVADANNHKIRKVFQGIYTINPALPSGLILDENTGIVSGSPLTKSSAKNYTITANNAAGSNSTIISIAVCDNTSSNSNISICPSALPYSWNGSRVAAGTYTYTTTNSSGCDSVATLNLTVKTVSNSTTNVSICPSALPYSWNGSRVAAGTYTYTTTNSVGCDSVATLNLTVKTVSNSTTNASICPSTLPYSWNGSRAAAGTYTYTTTNSSGCDSVATLNLTVKANTTSTTNASICSNALPYSWNGSRAAAGTYTYTTTNSVGCDSVATLNLSVTQAIIPSVSIAITSGTQSICAGASVTFTVTPTNGGATPSYQWKKNGSNVGSNSTTYTTTALVDGDILSCVLTANNTCQTTATATSNSITELVTANVTPNVSIATNSTTVTSGTSVTFTATLTDGGSSPSYQWKKNGGNVGSNSSTYTTNTIANNDVISCVLTANNTCQTTASASSNSITMTITAATTWTGTVSTDWNTPANWNINAVPVANSSVTIPSIAAKQPILSGDVAVTDIALGGSLAMNGHTFTIKGAVIGLGYLKVTSNSSLIISGNAGTINFDPSSNSLGNLTITTGSVTLGNALNVTSAFTPTAGTFNTGGNLTLTSTSIANSAIVGVVGGTVNGNVNVERYIPAGYRAYRDMAAQVYGSTLFNSWQEGGSFTSGKGIFITGASATDANKADYASQPIPNSNGLDYSLNGINSAYTYSYPNFTAIANTKVVLDPFVGYRVLIRGDRSFNLATTPIVNYYNIGLRMVNATVLRSIGGKLITGTVIYNTSGASGTTSDGASISSSAAALSGSSTTVFSLIANPYVCPVLWGDGTPSIELNTNTVFGNSSGINGSFWYLDPTYSATGTYLAFNALSGFSASGSSNTHIPTSYIQPGQAVFVQNSNSTNPIVKFTEATKAVNSTKAAVFGTTKRLSKIFISLHKLNDSASSYNIVDGAAIAFNANFTNTSYGPQDASKISSTTDNLSILDKGKNLSIDGRLPAVANDVLPLILSKVSGKKYQLVIDASAYDVNGYLPVLKDNFIGTVKALSIGVDTISFTVDSALSASYATRFSLGFKPTTLAVNSLVASATLSNKIATISWNTVGEKGVSRFEVEKSTDAKSFTKIGQAIAKNTATATYSITDNNVVSTISYYRIKAISEVGTVSYSNVAKVQLSVNSKQFTVYPNPLVGKTLNVSFGNIAAGKYTVTINNVLGQKVQEVAISHVGGNGTHAITVSKTLAAGIYSVTIRETAGGTIVSQSNLSVN